MKFGTRSGCLSCHTSKCALLVCILTLYLLPVSVGLTLYDWGCGEAVGKGLTGTNNYNINFVYTKVIRNSKKKPAAKSEV